MRFPPIIAVCLIVLLGCEAHRFALAPKEPDQSKRDLAAFKRLHMAILRPPDPSEIDDASTDAWLEKVSAQEASWRAQHLIDQLRSTEAFRDVEYSDAIGSPPNAIVSPLHGPRRRGPNSVDSGMIAMLTLGIVPVHWRYDNGMHFRRVDRDAPDFHCDWPVESVFGWLGLALRLSPEWEYGWADAAREAHFRSCLESYGASNLE